MSCECQICGSSEKTHQIVVDDSLIPPITMFVCFGGCSRYPDFVAEDLLEDTILDHTV